MSTGRWAPTVQVILHRELRRYAARRCLAWEGGSATYAETFARCASLAVWLQRHTERGDRVAIAVANGREYVEWIVATALAGRVRVPLNVKEATTALDHKVRLTTPRVLVVDASSRASFGAEVVAGVEHVIDPGAPTYAELLALPAAAMVFDAHADDTYRLSFTGGTTGEPKGIVQTHRQEIAMIRNLLMETIRPDDGTTFVAATPLSHASGAFVVPTLLRGGAVSWLSRFDPARVVDSSWLGRRTRVETFLVPTALADVAAAARGRDHDIATIVYGGAPCAPATLADAVATFGERLVQVYGQAEVPMTIAVLPREAHADTARVAGSAGFPFLFVDVAVMSGDGRRLPDGEVGEILVAAEHVMAGYWGIEGLAGSGVDDEGWLHTGDIGYIDEDGLLRLVGRARNIVISGGVNIYPDDVDRRLSGIEGVGDLASFGVPHPRWGEALVVAIAADGSVPVDDLPGLVTAVAAERLGTYERPKHVVVLDRLPLTDVGKTDKRRLSDEFGSVFEAVGA